MAEKKKGSVAVVVVTLLLGALFVYAGLANFLFEDNARRQFDAWGYPDWIREVVGVLEIAGGLLLLLPRTTWIGALLLLIVTVAGMATLLRFGGLSGVGLLGAAMPGMLVISLCS